MMKRLAARDISLQGRPGAFAGSLMNSSADLVARACQGDQEAFRLIFERYSRPLISFIYDQVSNRELAEELTQETFVRAYRGLHTLRTETKLSTWLFGIAKNVARESLRARVRDDRHVDLEDRLVLNLSDRVRGAAGGRRNLCALRSRAYGLAGDVERDRRAHRRESFD